MNDNEPLPERLPALLEAAVERPLTADETAELNELLLGSRAARDYYRRYLDVHVGLQLLHAPAALSLPSGLESIPDAPARQWFDKRRRWFALAAATVLLAALGSAWVLVSLSRQDQAPAVAETRLYVARVTFSEDANWGPRTTVRREDEWITAGTLELAAGRVEITFDSGATVLMSGSAELDIRSPLEVFLARGAVRVQVPEPARGFLLRTAQGLIEDLGTEFAVDVADGNKTEVHVIRGAVRAVADTGTAEKPEKRLDERQAVRIESNAFEPVTFAVTETLRPPARPAAQESLMLRYSFEEPDGTVVRDTGNFPRHYDGTLGNTHTGGPFPVRIDGRFGRGLEFVGNDAVVETAYPGIGGNKPRTVCFWVRIQPDADPATAFAIVTWGLGEAGRRWQIGWNHNPRYGTVGAVRTDFWGGYVTGTTDLRDGKWHHVASLFIGGQYADIATHVRHYIDGRLEGVSGSLPRRIDTELSHPKSVPVIMGRKVDYDRRDGKAYRTFKGGLDEVLIVDGALEPRQILNLVQQNALESEQR